MPCRIGRQSRLRSGGDHRQVRGRKHPLPRVARRIAPRLQLLKMGDFQNIHFGGEVSAGGRPEPFIGEQRPAGQRPRVMERRLRALPQQYVQPPIADLEHDPERLMTEAVSWHRAYGSDPQKFSPGGSKP